MKISELINYFQDMHDTHGDHEITKVITGIGNQFKPVNIKLELDKTGWVKKRTVTEDEEITVKKRATVYKLRIDEDTD